MCDIYFSQNINLYFMQMTAIITTLIPLLGYAQAPSPLICPSPTSISPCACIPFTGYRQSINNGIKIGCAGKNLTDFQISRVLNAFLAPGLSLVQEISAPLNQLTKVPNQVSKFIALQVVDFSSNKITEIPDDDGKPFFNNRYPNDTAFSIKISLRNNLIRRVPSGSFCFPSAFKVEIYLTDNKIASVRSNDFRFPAAVVVDLRLDSNQISVFPDGIFSYPTAIDLRLSLGGNQVKAVPSAAVFNFPSARSVSIMLDSNKITSISKDSFNFTFNVGDTVYIDLSRNGITTIPCGAFNYPSLESVYVHLHYNQIKTVPSCTFNFPSAKYGGVGLSNNLITNISPGVFNFPSGVNMGVSLSYNQISALPPDTFAQGNKYIILHYGFCHALCVCFREKAYSKLFYFFLRCLLFY